MAGKPGPADNASASRLPIAILLAVMAAVTLWNFDRSERRSPSPELLQIRPPPRADGPVIRVNLTPQRSRQLRCAVDGGFRLRQTDGGRILAHSDRLPASLVTGSFGGIRIGDREYPVQRIQIEPDSSPAIWINDHQYRGVVRIDRQDDHRLLAVNVVPLDDYMASVIDSEMPASFPAEARRAQAIVARTYALDRMRTAPAGSLFDVDTSSNSQHYLGVQYRNSAGQRLAGESADSRRIVRESRGMICTHDGRLFRTYYSAVCGGRTTNGRALFPDAAPPLASVPCEWCRAAKRYRWNSQCPRSTLEAVLQRHFASRNIPFGRLTAISAPTTAADGTIPELRVSDGDRTYHLPSTVLRRYLPRLLLSPFFQVQTTETVVYFHGRGHGHGSGMCQWGARGLALAGKDAIEIVRYYYPGSQVAVRRDDELARQ